MRDYEKEIKQRVAFIREVLKSANVDGIVYGNSGGKDSALVGILCKIACENTVGIIMPCGSKRNYNEDKNDAESVANQFHIETRLADLTEAKNTFIHMSNELTKLTEAAISNIAPRLRMITLYMVAASENRLVAGTGNRSEGYMGYFTKWGDGAFDFNPIADLTVTEIYDFLRYLNAPVHIIDKAPSAGLFDGQTDESEMGVTYKSIDSFLLDGFAKENDQLIIEKYHEASEHKRKMPITYGG
ncbi:NAD(+) synthase [Paludicola sp. MB14-C6]|uniref:NAD(+) synthase n=1 Tax=Paludihabitans sp. MB14-C6 TaxID=3070656 RepID=UPI0027DDB64D|nr:NAD(+) synthase [Paludicola sp. MB14-C6]WMJ23221.1 NAD(+) synthase [Paludicola sp. MB14-C6]